MKRLLYLIILFPILLSGSCDHLYFEQPQPQGRANIYSFDKQHQGHYINKKDSTSLIITANKVVQKYLYLRVAGSVSDLDSLVEGKIEDGYFYPDDIEGRYKIEYKQDSVCVNLELDTTLFEISDNNILRYYNNQYYLNIKRPDGWILYVLVPKKNQVKLISIYADQDEMKKLSDITSLQEISKTDTTYVLVANPDIKQLEKIITMDIFNPKNVFDKKRNRD